MRIAIVPWLSVEKYPGTTMFVPDILAESQMSALDLRPYGRDMCIVVMPDRINALPAQGGRRLDLGDKLDIILTANQANVINSKLSITGVSAGMTVGQALRLLITSRLLPGKDGQTRARLDGADLMNDMSVV